MTGRPRRGRPTRVRGRGDIVVVTIPLKAVDPVPVEPLAGKVVIDTNNYYPGRDGQIADLDEHTTLGGPLRRTCPARTSSRGSTTSGRPPRDRGPAGRHAGSAGPPVAGDDADAATSPWSAGSAPTPSRRPVGEGLADRPGPPGYGPALDADGMRQVLADAAR